jgi:glucan phosphoethanolaminetransferase (alkaline phosphatase superfamily)
MDPIIVFFTIIFLLALLIVYFLPTIIAFSRKHRNRWLVLWINTIFGSTIIGWFGALIWALNKLDDPLKGGVKHDCQPHDPIV